MTNPQVDIRVLATLARLELSHAEVEKMQMEIPGVLSFVEQIQSVVAEVPKAVSPQHRGILRFDALTHESGIYTEALLSAAPAREGNQVSVKQVLSRKK